MAMSDFLEQEVAKHFYGGTPASQPTAWNIALFNTDPTDTGGGIEVTGGGYARQSFTPSIGASPTSIVSNGSDIVFPTATGNWTTANFIAVFDQLGNLLDYGAMTTPRTVLTDGVFKILANGLNIQYT